MIASLRTRGGIAAIVCLAGLVLPTTLAAQQPVQIHPASGMPSGPIVIAVLADHFTVNQEAAFNQAAANFLIHGLLAEPFFAAHKPAITIKTVFQPWVEGTPSNYGFVLEAGKTNCSINWADNTPQLIEAAVRASVNPAHVVVIGNHRFNFGCQEANWAYVARGAVGQQVLEHEFGHLLTGLYDEFSDPNQRPIHPGGIDRANCSSRNPPQWTPLGLPGVTNSPGCDLHAAGIVRPFPDCKMRSPRTKFCEVCSRELHSAISCFGKEEPCNPAPPGPNAGNRASPPAGLPTTVRVSGAGFFLQPPPPPQLETSSVQLLLRVNRTGNITVLTATDVVGPVISQHRRVGDYAYEITDSGKTIAVAVVPGDPFKTRSSRGGAGSHSNRDDDGAATILVSVPQATRETLRGRAIEIAFYRLGSTGNRGISPDTLPGLRSEKQATRFAGLPVDALRIFLSKR